jgi:3-methylfumaryl-CoA hydratase
MVDIEHLRRWIGRTEEAADTLDRRLAASLLAALDRDPCDAVEGAPAPLCAHWCLAPPIVPNSGTGADGHPARGDFLPPVPLPRRIWAGGAIRFLAPIRVGDTVRRHSTVRDVTLKEGRSGTLVFVTVEHSFLGPDGTAVEERQDIVYREPSGAAPAAGTPALPADVVAAFDPSPLALFRYSAVTFNGHRIHYDRTYAMEVEGYGGLVVHGPLQATLLANFAARHLGRPPARFTYRGVRPLIDTEGPLELRLWPADNGVRLATVGADGLARMEAEAS